MHLSAEKQASGEARYTDDMPRLEGETYAALVLSDRAHAKFTLDSSDVEMLEVKSASAADNVCLFYCSSLCL